MLDINSISQPRVSQSEYEHVHIKEAVFAASGQLQSWTSTTMPQSMQESIENEWFKNLTGLSMLLSPARVTQN